MSFRPEYTRDQVQRLIAAGGLSVFEVYRLEHQHPLNQLTHALGIPLIAASVAYPAYVWAQTATFAWVAWLALGVTGWALQLLGHWIEGNKPAFVADPRQFAVGPVFFLAKPYYWLYEQLRGRPYWRQLEVPPAPPDAAA